MTRENPVINQPKNMWWHFMNFLGYRRVFYLHLSKEGPTVEVSGRPMFIWVYDPRLQKRDYTQIDSPFINKFYKW